MRHTEEEGDLLSSVSLAKCPNQLGLGQTKTRGCKRKGFKESKPGDLPSTFQVTEIQKMGIFLFSCRSQEDGRD